MAERDARERILEAACDLSAADGIADVRIARVAMRAGASTALVHHYFSTREELLEQALLHSFEQVGEERFAEAGEAPNAHAPGHLRARAAPLGGARPPRRTRPRPPPARREPLRPVPRLAGRGAETRHR